MKNPYFGRLLTAMVTPFNADGSVNYENAADLADWLIAHGSNGLVVAGSTGEAATMTVDEKLELFRVGYCRYRLQLHRRNCKNDQDGRSYGY